MSDRPITVLTYPQPAPLCSSSSAGYPQHTQRRVVLRATTDAEPKAILITMNVDVIDLPIITVSGGERGGGTAQQ